MKITKRILKIFVALVLISIGIVGVFMPILNGIIFLLLGLILLSFENKFIHHHLEKNAAKNEHINKWYKKLDLWMRKLFN